MIIDILLAARVKRLLNNNVASNITHAVILDIRQHVLTTLLSLSQSINYVRDMIHLTLLTKLRLSKVNGY